MVTPRNQRNIAVPIIKAVLLLAVLTGGVIWYMVTHSPAAMVRKQLLSAIQQVSKPSGEGNAVTAFKLLAFEHLLDEQITCNVRDFPYNGTSSANSFASLVFRGRSYPESIDLSISAMECEFPRKNQARVRCLARAVIHMGGRRADESRNCIILMTKRDRNWLISGVQDDDLLKK